MEKLKEYLHQILGKDLEIKELSKDYTNKLPFIFKNNFNFYITHLHNHELILVQVNKEDAFNAAQLRQQVLAIQNVLNNYYCYQRHHGLIRKPVGKQKLSINIS